MRNIVRCDICNKEVIMDKPRIPEGFILIDELDFCKECHLEFIKRKRVLIKQLQKERFK